MNEDAMNDSAPLKQCSKKSLCIHPDKVDDGWLPATTEFFYADKNAASGLRSPCKRCFCKTVSDTQDMERKKKAVKRYAAAHPEVHQKAKQNFKERHPGKAAEYNREWYWSNLEQQRERCRKYKAGHHDQNYRRNKQYAQSHRERNRLTLRRYVARKRKLADTLTAAEWNYALEYFGNACAVCGRPEGNGYHLAADHWIPLISKDCPGTTRLNIVPLCHSITKGAYGACNNSKHAAMPKDWLTRVFGEERGLEILHRVESYFEHLRSVSS